ncbi:hypothetical protein GPJ56_009629 [Histomonas meleagridis]|uniref:uncharacterized protein n=1 Tax=Histomonas meleagridis TaxID=135588 RepID=UPI003559C8B5|nr:hypothetical protein GPJ56_009629 [Histomonas meleagridis]KAH0804368.1 hypothetical protein GO595_003198 [Histomonas meleagridis]
MIIESIFIEKIDPEKLATFSQTSPRIRRKQNEKNEVMTPRQLIEEKISPESLRRYSVFPKSQGMRKLRVALKTDSNTSIISNDESESTDIIKEKIPIPRATFAQSIGSAESKRVKPVFTLPHNVQRPIPIFEDTEESSSVINDSTKSNNIITPSSLNDVQFINNENSPNNQNVNNNNSPNNQNVNNNNNSPNNQNINVNNSRTNTPTNNQNVNVNINTPTNNQNVNNSQMNTPTNNQNVNVINRQNSPRYNNSPNQHVEPKQPMLRLAPRVNNSELDAFPSFKPIVQQLKKKEADEESTSDNDEKKNERRKSTTSKRRNSAQPPTPINHVEPKTLRTANDFISEFYDNTDETFEFKQKNNNTNENNNNNKTEEEAMAGQWFATTRTRRSSTIKNPTILYQKLFVEESEDASSSKKRKRRRRRSKDEKSFHRHSRRSSKSQISLEVNSETEDANQEKTNANVENTEKIRPVLLGPIHARKNPKHQMGSPDRVGRRFVAENIGEMLQKPMSQIE